MRSDAQIQSIERASRGDLAVHQAERLRRLLRATYGRNPFYTRKLDRAGIAISELQFPQDLSRLPLTAKSELAADQAAHPPWGTALSEPIERYTRYCQTSSTTGSPLRWLDTNENWQSLVECWKTVYRAARVGPGDRIFFAFSFGPFLGFWLAFEAGCQMSVHCVPGGGMASEVRLAAIRSVGATVLCCTPTYALRLAELAARETQAPPLRESSVRVVIVAGEPGGSIPATRDRIGNSWGARVIDHHGLTETGPLSFECWENPGGLHVNEGEYICEVLDPASCQALPDGQPGELVVTTLGRVASPVIRYRTGDLVVRNAGLCRCGRTWARLEGGILGRIDDMITIRGVNVYPAAIEAVVRRFPEIVEFRSTVSRTNTMRALSIEIELSPDIMDAPAIEERLSRQLLESLGLHVAVRTLEPCALPRFEMKAQRFVIQ